MSRQLAIDRGNSFTKLSVADGLVLQTTLSMNDEQLKLELPSFLTTVKPDAIIISDVRDRFPFEVFLKNSLARIIRLSPSLTFPFTIGYQTPESIGPDRLANISGATLIAPGQNVLVIDCGTCITYSLLFKGVFLGGSIAPGIYMRYRALHEFTGKLPQVEATLESTQLLGTSTNESIQSGVQKAVLLETDGMIDSYRSQFEDLQVVITGGDYSFFENNLKSRIFAHPELTRIGLHEILRINRS